MHINIYIYICTYQQYILDNKNRLCETSLLPIRVCHSSKLSQNLCPIDTYYTYICVYAQCLGEIWLRPCVATFSMQPVPVCNKGVSFQILFAIDTFQVYTYIYVYSHRIYISRKSLGENSLLPCVASFSTQPIPTVQLEWLILKSFPIIYVLNKIHTHIYARKRYT